MTEAVHAHEKEEAHNFLPNETTIRGVITTRVRVLRKFRPVLALAPQCMIFLNPPKTIFLAIIFFHVIDEKNNEKTLLTF